MLQLLEPYWGIIALVVMAALYVPTHYKASLSFTRKVALQFIFAAEKRAEELLLSTGQQKLDWVVDKGYDLMPAAVRIVVSKPLFRIIVQQVFDMAVSFAKKHEPVVTTKALPPPPEPQSNTSAPV